MHREGKAHNREGNGDIIWRRTYTRIITELSFEHYDPKNNGTVPLNIKKNLCVKMN